MSKIAAHIATRSTEFFPFALIGIGLIATTVWVGTLVLAVFGGAWSILSGILWRQQQSPNVVALRWSDCRPGSPHGRTQYPNSRATDVVPVVSYQSAISWPESQWELAIAFRLKPWSSIWEGAMCNLRIAESAQAVFGITLLCALVFLSAVIPA